MEDVDIYEDLYGCGVNLSEEVSKVQEENNKLVAHIAILESNVAELLSEITIMKEAQDTLTRNISELYNTAKNELQRKDRMINKLQTELDDILFNRKNRTPFAKDSKQFGARQDFNNRKEPIAVIKAENYSAASRSLSKEAVLEEGELPRNVDYKHNMKKDNCDLKRNRDDSRSPGRSRGHYRDNDRSYNRHRESNNKSRYQDHKYEEWRHRDKSHSRRQGRHKSNERCSRNKSSERRSKEKHSKNDKVNSVTSSLEPSMKESQKNHTLECAILDRIEDEAIKDPRIFKDTIKSPHPVIVEVIKKPDDGAYQTIFSMCRIEEDLQQNEAIETTEVVKTPELLKESILCKDSEAMQQMKTDILQSLQNNPSAEKRKRNSSEPPQETPVSKKPKRRKSMAECVINEEKLCSPVEPKEKSATAAKNGEEYMQEIKKKTKEPIIKETNAKLAVSNKIEEIEDRKKSDPMLYTPRHGKSRVKTPRKSEESLLTKINPQNDNTACKNAVVKLIDLTETINKNDKEELPISQTTNRKLTKNDYSKIKSLPEITLFETNHNSSINNDKSPRTQLNGPTNSDEGGINSEKQLPDIDRAVSEISETLGQLEGEPVNLKVQTKQLESHLTNTKVLQSWLESPIIKPIQVSPLAVIHAVEASKAPQETPVQANNTSVTRARRRRCVVKIRD